MPDPTPTNETGDTELDYDPTTIDAGAPDGDPSSDENDDGEEVVADEGGDGEGGFEDDPVAAARREAARHRRRLREVEAERDALAETVATYRRREAEVLADATLQSGGDLWAAGVELEALLGEDGTVDEARVSAAVAKVAADRPHWRRRQPDLDAGARRPAGGNGFDFGAELRRAAGAG